MPNTKLNCRIGRLYRRVHQPVFEMELYSLIYFSYSADETPFTGSLAFLTPRSVSIALLLHECTLPR
jgi:hypothetical protein